MNKASENGHLEVVKWLHTNRSEGCIEDAIGNANARFSRHTEIVQWLEARRR
jgi:hypothetical protein